MNSGNTLLAIVVIVSTTSLLKGDEVLISRFVRFKFFLCINECGA